MTPEQYQAFLGSIGDVIRACCVWGAEAAKGNPDEIYNKVVWSRVSQMFQNLTQREPTDAEWATIWGQPAPVDPPDAK